MEHRMNAMDTLLSLKVGERVVITNLPENTVRCAAFQAKKRWGRWFSVNRTDGGVIAQRTEPNHLQSAAPDLLEALQGILNSEAFNACDCGLPECKTTKARAAVAKALGSAS
jgi:hypothetical protein